MSLTRSIVLRAAVLALAAALLVGTSPQAVAAEDVLTRHTFAGAAGTRDYLMFRPAGNDPAPLIVFLHGCGAPPAAYGLHQFGALQGFAVVYPVQSSSANAEGCWNWVSPDHQHRGSGEPSIIAGITNEVVQQQGIDPSRVFVAGHSAGSGMTAVMSAAYPDLYAAAGLIAGCGQLSCRDVTGLSAYREMGPRARPVPAYIAWGSKDQVNPYATGRLQLLQWLGMNDFADDGLPLGSVPRVPTSVERRAAGVDHNAFTVEHYRDARDCGAVDFATDIGAGHVPDFNDPVIFPAMTAFLLAHEMRDSC